MEDVLAVDTRPRDPDGPLVCLAEASTPRMAATRTPTPMQQGQPARVDAAEARNGTATLVLLCAPLAGWRPGKVTDRPRAVDEAHARKERAAIHCPKAPKIVVVQDTLTTHTTAALSAAFPAAAARRLAARCALHATPTHGSGLAMAESARRVLSSPCRDRRLPDTDTLIAAIAAWEKDRNTPHTKADWQCTTEDARVRLKRLSPQFD